MKYYDPTKKPQNMMSVTPLPEKSARKRSILSLLLASTRNTADTKSSSRVESEAMLRLIVRTVCPFFLRKYLMFIEKNICNFNNGGPDAHGGGPAQTEGAAQLRVVIYLKVVETRFGNLQEKTKY